MFVIEVNLAISIHTDYCVMMTLQGLLCFPPYNFMFKLEYIQKEFAKKNIYEKLSTGIKLDLISKVLRFPFRIQSCDHRKHPLGIMMWFHILSMETFKPNASQYTRSSIAIKPFCKMEVRISTRAQ